MADKKLYFAPLEGITTYMYRNIHNEMFGGCDAYYAPFITPSDNEKIGRKGFRDVLPENNAGVNLKLQVLTNYYLIRSGFSGAQKYRIGSDCR